MPIVAVSTMVPAGAHIFHKSLMLNGKGWQMVTNYLPVVAQTCFHKDSRKWKNGEKTSICMYAKD
jgi:hypothetical protein